MVRPACSSTLCLLLGLVGAIGAQTTQTVTYKVGGTSRSFVVHVPAGASKPPVVFFVHGYGGSGGGFENDTKADKVADREKFIAVYPSAVGGSWSMYDTTDYPFLLSIVDTVDARYKIDRKRVYCAGFSQGGFISFGLGYKHPETFAAVAPVSGHIPSFSTTAPLKRPVPMFLTFGTNDISNVASFMADVTTWLRLDGCPSTATRIRPYPSTRPRSAVARIVYSCAQGSEVMIDSVMGGGHEWAMDTTTKVNTTEEVWAFFKRFTLDGTSSVSEGTGSATGNVIAAHYAAGRVRLDGFAGDATVEILDARGTSRARVPVIGGEFEFRQAPRGLYLAVVSGAMERRAVVFSVP